MMSTVSRSLTQRSRPRTLALELVESLGDRIRDGRLAPGDKAADRGGDHGRVRRQPHRRARGPVQAAGRPAWCRRATASAPSSSAVGEAAPFRIAPEQLATLRDVIAVLELRIGVETEAASLAAQRRTTRQPGRDARRARRRSPRRSRPAATQSAADFQFHLEIARATQNAHFADLMAHARHDDHSARAPGPAGSPLTDERRDYLRRVNGEHESIFDAIAAQDTDAARAAMRTHLANSRERRRRASDLPARTA